MFDEQASPPNLIRQDARVLVRGDWRVLALAELDAARLLRRSLGQLRGAGDSEWDLREATAIDHVGAQWLWNAWGKRRPARLLLAPEQEETFARIEQAGTLTLPKPPAQGLGPPLAAAVAGLLEHLMAALAMVGQLVLDLGRFLARPWRGPLREISAQLFHVGYQALGITALVGFLIGVVLSYLSAQQLRAFGGDAFLVNILGMSIIRELGPMLAAILVAGRSGSSITAQLGVMRVNEELDAMTVMNMPHGFTLVLPRVLALAIAMPLLVVWTDAAALLGGMVAAWLELGLTFTHFLNRLPEVVPLANYFLGLFKGVSFGILIALVACHFGLRVAPNTESLGRGTTASVVTAITLVILADAVFAIVFKSVGLR